MPSPTDPLRSLTDGSYRFQMALRPGPGTPFFAPTPNHAEVMAERRSLLGAHPGLYAAALPGTARLLDAAAALVHGWLADTPTAPPPPPPAPRSEQADALAAWCARTGQAWEPDWVVLQRDNDATYRLAAGAVCFPSGWALPDKLGHPLEAIHAPVPGLNHALGRQIHVFLERLKPGAVWWRDNWGLSADSALNHHPSRHGRPLTTETPLTAAWLRYEEQLLARLPGSRDVLFGIRVGRVRLAEILPFPEVTRRLAEALRTMPEDVAVYKGIAAARTSLLRQLDAVRPRLPPP
jgi:hypothetical protein